MFEQSKLKIERADHHIQDLNAYIVSILKDHLYTLSIEDHPQTGIPGLVCRLCDTPAEIALFIGDIAHNMRSALDILYCDILRHEGRTVGRNSKWPFRERREELIAGFNGREEQDRPSDGIIKLIVDSIQTYRGGNGDALYALNDLNIEDKHMLLTPMISVSRIWDVQYIHRNGHPGRSEFSAGGGTNAPTNIQFRSDSSIGVREITNHGKATFDVFFGKGAFHGQPLVPTLRELSQLVSATVETVENFLMSNSAPD